MGQRYGEVYVHRSDDGAVRTIARDLVYSFLRQAQLVWAIDDLNTGADVVGYQAVWDAATHWGEGNE